MTFPSIQMNNGEVFSGEKIGELTEFIIKKFSEENLSRDEAIHILTTTSEIIGEYAIVRLSD
ncbi:hypothetical protein [Hespellia stercorisuis]|uniref:Uncharacterized protein n=1 Tax=Hespellia stercorisuis DSM 15480 TaxID=1121950 RepID=A0A1M6TSU9_9FIRM|nr:hypothetical protein [Hespellia stercorisuis]SHK59980.1 hypothetical protein SAMN02745243_03319 [Hespellia stercorisuis DSM 15480]